MATQHVSPAPPAPVAAHAYPMAKAGYGKRTTPGQNPRSRDDFALLPARERYVAGFIDQLPDGAAISVKQLAKHCPLYGQQAIATSLNSLSVAGHFRRVRSQLITDRDARTGRGGEVRWIYRTFWSRTARDNEWWNTYLATNHTTQPIVPANSPALQPSWPPHAEAPAPWTTAEDHEQLLAPPQTPSAAQPLDLTTAPRQRTSAPDSPQTHHEHQHAEQAELGRNLTHPTPHGHADHASPTQADTPAAPALTPSTTPGEIPAALRSSPAPEPSPAYLALARLGRDDHRLALSAADCATLEPLASAWLARGVSVDYLTTALTAGLPARIDSPAGLLHRRLTDKIPPHLPGAAEVRSQDAREPIYKTRVECTNCHRPGPPEALPDGLCRPCHHAHTHGNDPTTPTPDEIAAVKAHIANLRNLLNPV
ncbi:MarR family transcriptional regulator [Streptomyces californicus]|uniref:MarR family transcriptional regulator n=1 Tax=Streptomyces californicus TaxID=67351 RepID=UPI00378C0BCE